MTGGALPQAFLDRHSASRTHSALGNGPKFSHLGSGIAKGVAHQWNKEQTVERRNAASSGGVKNKSDGPRRMFDYFLRNLPTAFFLQLFLASLGMSWQEDFKSTEKKLFSSSHQSMLTTFNKFKSKRIECHISLGFCFIALLGVSR
jgi:hypothetical protein